MKTTIKRSTNFIEFTSGIETNGCHKGEKLYAYKNETWHIYNPRTGLSYNTPTNTLRVMIEQGKLIEQCNLMEKAREYATNKGIEKIYALVMRYLWSKPHTWEAREQFYYWHDEIRKIEKYQNAQLRNC